MTPTVPFTTPVRIEILADDFFETVEPLNFYSPIKNKNYVVPAGYRTDLSSVPRVPIIFLWAGGRGKQAGIVHDWLYDYGKKMKQIENRQEADEVYREILLDSQVSPVCAWAMYQAVMHCGEDRFSDR